VLSLLGDKRVNLIGRVTCRWHSHKARRGDSDASSGEPYLRRETQWFTSDRHLVSSMQAIFQKGIKNWDRRVDDSVHGFGMAEDLPTEVQDAIVSGLAENLYELDEMNASLPLIGPVPAVPFPTDAGAKGRYYDDLTGATLEAPLVEAARKEELDWIRARQVYIKVPLTTCYSETGRAPITLKWIDTNKGDEANKRYRSRLVVREIKYGGQRALPDHMLFSSMPPLEAVKVLCSLMVSVRVNKRKRAPYSMKLFDISRAHFYGASKRRVFVTLPEGDELAEHCALLQRTMYGTQDASAVWQQDYTVLLLANGFVKGSASTAIFFHEDLDIRVLVHGDDFLTLADQEGLRHTEKVLAGRYDYKVVGSIGPDPSDKGEMCVLNRTIRYVDGEVEYEADLRHAELIVRELGLETAKSVSAPGTKKTQRDVAAAAASPKLGSADHSSYRSVTMRGSYLAQDRTDLCESVKNLARSMQAPTQADLQDLKHFGRYLKGCPRVVWRFQRQHMIKNIRVFTDADHAGCLKTRRSTSGMCAMLGRHCVKGSSTLQSTIALSVGESEFYALTKGAAFGLQLQGLLRDWGYQLPLVIVTDSNSAIGTVSRQGLGKLRHVQTRYLWVQERVARNELTTEKVGTLNNPSDMGTKPLSRAEISKFMKILGQSFEEGRAASAKELVG
jgi:hypothetical protein